jgi:hypothetical protein
VRVEHGSRMGEEGLARARRRDPAARAVQQMQAELLLQTANRLTHGRLRDPEALGGAAEVALLGDGDEGGELALLHVAQR